MSADILFPITHLKCDDRGIFAVGCGSDVLVLGLLLVKGYLHERMGGRNGKRGRKVERDGSYSLHVFTVLFNSRGERRRGEGMTGGSGGWGWDALF